jgi:copper homeostasis protein CutC
MTFTAVFPFLVLWRKRNLSIMASGAVPPCNLSFVANNRGITGLHRKLKFIMAYPAGVFNSVDPV